MQITRILIPNRDRVSQTAKLFGLHFPLLVEPTAYAFAGRLSTEYDGGYWDFFTLSNGGFYMAPDAQHDFAVSSENGFEGRLSADAFGLTVCLYTYSQLSFQCSQDLAETCAEQYHRLRDYLFTLPEAERILRAID